MITIAELLMDLRLLTVLEDLPPAQRTNKTLLEAQYLIPDVLHSINIAILALFLLESSVEIIAFGLAFLRMGWEVFDCAIIVTTFICDVLMEHSHSTANGLGLLIIMRLWRVARILNGTI